MDSSFIMKPRALSLITRAPVNPQCSSGQRVGLLRSEFLRCDHNIRRPEDLLSYRRKYKKLKLRPNSHYYKYVIRVSLDSQPTIVFPAVATFSALTVVFLTYSKKQFDVMQVKANFIVSKCFVEFMWKSCSVYWTRCISMILHLQDYDSASPRFWCVRDLGT